MIDNKWLPLVAIILVVCLAMLRSCADTPKYAVLLSSNEVFADDIAYHSVWWYDLVVQYRMLRESGFKDEHIFVLYGSGSDFSSHHAAYDTAALFGTAITDLPMNKAEVQKVFQTVNNKMSRRGYLYVWWMGHGSGSGTGQCDLSMQISHTGEEISDDEFRSYVDQVARYNKRSILIMTCHSGGLLDEFSAPGERNIVLASSTCPQSSYEGFGICNGINHAEFNYTATNALRQIDPCGTTIPSDTDGTAGISLDETHQYNVSAMSRSTPQLADPDTLAATTIPARKKP